MSFFPESSIGGAEKKIAMSGISAIILILACMLWVPSITAQCIKEITIVSDVELMDKLPTYSTKRGWQYGHSLGQIPSGTRVCILEKRKVGFFGNTQKWIKVQWKNRVGWIYKKQLSKQSMSLLKRLFASIMPSSAFANSDPDIPLLFDPIILGSFISLILGMIAKNIFDLFYKLTISISFTKFLKRLIAPLVISPIIFLGFIKLADFGITDSISMLIFFLFAFQNGFFWQDVLGKELPSYYVKKSVERVAG